MESDRFEQKEAEFKKLQAEYLNKPELFKEQSIVEDSSLLSPLGIEIPGKEFFPKGYLKLWPEDFIVEERSEGSIQSVQSTPALPPTELSPTYYATLVKGNISTFEAINDIAKQLNIRPEDLSFAGLKDKNAITSQRISIRRAKPDALAKLSSPYYYFSNWESGKGVIQRGNLEGNHFSILVRTEKEFFNPENFSRFAPHLKHVKENGFANFFYLQRFGTSRLRNYVWALLILHGKYEEAIHDFLCYAGPNELPYFQELRKSLKDDVPNWDAIYAKLSEYPIIFEQELAVVQHLRQHPTDFTGAFQKIPEQITFWLYALSSLFFNKKISEYLLQEKPLPPTLPFFLSKNKEDLDPYKKMLSDLGITVTSFQNLRPFPQIILKNRTAPTMCDVKIYNAQLIDDVGISLEFDLGKGSYATTMLSHMFNLVGGIPMPSFSKERVDVKAILGHAPLASTLEYFSTVIKPKGDGFAATVEDV
jgi:tRNA(Glu) U13 pseudouridine synthase TruD